MIGALVLLSVLAIAGVALLPPVRRGDAARTSVALRWAALALAVTAAALLFAPTWADSGAFAVWGLGLPVAVAALPVLALRTRASTVVPWVCAALLLGWSVLLALGIGLWLLPAALLELAAAATQRRAGRLPA
jgi:hypothetical protein